MASPISRMKRDYGVSGLVEERLGTPYGGASWLIFWAASSRSFLGGGGRAVQAGDERLGRRALRLPQVQLAILALLTAQVRWCW